MMVSSSADLSDDPAPVLRSATKAEAVADWLRQRLAEGAWQPGEPLPQLTIAAKLGVSQTPVREAIRLLAAEGLVDMSAHLSATVPRLDHGAVVELYAMRAALEGLATETATARLAGSERIALIKRLRDIQRSLEAATRKGGEGAPALNQDFHFTLYAAAEMPRLMEAIRRLWGQMPAYWLRTIPGRAKDQAAHHLPILAAIERGDAVAAGAAMRRHIQSAAESLQNWLTSQGKGGA